MSKGRKPLPTNLKIIKGTARKHRLDKREPRPKANAIRRPASLSEEASKHWTKICRQLKDCGVMTNLDAVALAMYCEAYARWQYANQELDKHGTLVDSPQGYPVPSPWLRISYISFDQMRRMMIEFGMTPSSRTKVRTVSQPDTEDPWEQF